MSTSSPSGVRRFASVNPATGETTDEFEFLPSEQVVPAVEEAHRAYLEWRARPVAERAAVVGRAAELMLEREDDLAATITTEMGKLIGEAHFEVRLAASILRYYAESGPAMLEPERLTVDKGEAEVRDHPVGVLLAIEPWNFPYYQVVRVAGPNLVLGNVILLKHAEINPRCALALESLFRDAGAPAGVFTNLFIRHDDVEAIIAHPAVAGVTLTGSERAGAAVAALAGKHLKKSVLELGGSDPFIVLDAPDMDAVVKTAATGRMANTGQSCVAAKRFIVPADLYDDFVAGLAARMGALQPGDPMDPGTTLGPLSSEQAAQDLAEQVRDAVEKGATVVAGGSRPDRPGAYHDATVLTGVTPEMQAYHEELFGPVAVVYRVADEDEAVELANATRFGLGGTVMCSDPERARRVAERIESGMVWINRPTSTAPELPFGGTKASGYGRELSHLGIHEFANRKLVRTFPAASGGRVAG